MENKRHNLHSPVRRGVYCLLLTVAVLFIGTFGMHKIEGFSYIDAFYFTSLIATGQGPAPSVTPVTNVGKIFTSILSFVAAGAMIASLGFLFGPFLGRLWHSGVLRFEEEIEHLKHEKNHAGKFEN